MVFSFKASELLEKQLNEVVQWHIKLSEPDMICRSQILFNDIIKRRTVRDFSNKDVPFEIIINAVKSASSAPSGANKQPWHFVIVKDPEVKKKIRVAAKKEEKQFYGHSAPEQWLKDLNQFGTSWRKPFLESSTYLIIVFKMNYTLDKGERKNNYYVNESVGTASGILLTALHMSGLATLTHISSPMGFLEKKLKRPKNEKAMLLIPVGYPSQNSKVPILEKEDINKACAIV